ncbi:MAG TPA: MFS transporter, partial [Thermoleophilia bacterium]
MLHRLSRSLREFRTLPAQFWVLTLGIFIYVAAAALAFPFEGIYLHTNLGVSMSMLGVVFGLVPVLVMPMQFWGGQLTDRLGRRWVILLSVSMGVVWFAGFAFVTKVWEVALLVAIESSLGWPLFQTASNAMIADLLPPEKRQEGFSLTRVAMNLGVVVGPAAAGLALGFGVTFRELFLAAAAGCALMVAIMFFSI